MTITPEQAEVISDAIESALIDVHVSLPGRVEKYDATTQTANVQLQVKRTLPKGDGSYATEDLPVLQNIPVAFPRTNNAILTFPISTGDYGLVVFSEMSIDQWRSKGENTSPGDVGRHTLSGGVFQPGLMPISETVTTDDLSSDVVLGFVDGVQLRAKSGGTIDAVDGGVVPGGQSAEDFVVMASRLYTAMTALLAAGAAVPAPANAGFVAAQTAWDTLVATPAGDIASRNLKANKATPVP